MYHSIETAVEMDPSKHFTVSESDFRAQLQWLRCESQFEIVRASQFSSSNSVALTFDDGYRSFKEHALPILEEFEIPATLFVSTDYVAREHPDFVTASDLRSLAMHPLVEIGSHTQTHPRLTSCTSQETRRELRESRKYLELTTGLKVEQFAFPNGVYNSRIVKQVADTGYRLAFCSQNTAADAFSNPLLLPRTCIFWGDGLPGFRARVFGHSDWQGTRLFVMLSTLLAKARKSGAAQAV